MADFSSDGFSAVAAFFGKADDDDAKSRKGSKANATKSTLQTSGGRKKDRLGLGAKSSATSNSSGTFVGNEASRTIMKVGKSKRGRDEDIEDNEVEDYSHDNEEEDDEEGRTSAVQPKSSRVFDVTSAAAAEPLKKKKKKKKGKKERAAESAMLTGTDEAENLPVKDLNDGEKKKKKSRKKKIRSRQKNIRKDTRRFKPSHLIIGSSGYAGLPLTAETREAMNMPESKTRQRAQRSAEMGEDQSDHIDGGARSNSSTLADDKGLGLAVDDMLDDIGVATDATNNSTNHKKKADEEIKKKKKQSKYKNLR